MRCSIDRDYERRPRHSEVLITWAAITLMTRRLARPGKNVPALDLAA